VEVDVDASGASCTGTVTVCVPRDQSHKGSKCTDGGARYDSTKGFERGHGHDDDDDDHGHHGSKHRRR
jgi:hypothetical protein